MEEDMEVRPAIQQIALEHRRRYGSRRIANPSFLDFGGGSGNGVPGWNGFLGGRGLISGLVSMIRLIIATPATPSTMQ